MDRRKSRSTQASTLVCERTRDLGKWQEAWRGGGGTVGSDGFRLGVVGSSASTEGNVKFFGRV